jgi:hypothetical protein
MPAAARPARSSAVQFIKWAAGASLILSLLQIMLGGDPVIILLCLLSEAVCLFPIYLYGLGRTVGILYIGVWLAFSFSALVGKTILLQPIDSNLFNPLLTFCVTLAGSFVFTIAATAAYFVKPLQKNAITVTNNHSILMIISLIFMAVGILVFSIGVYAPKQSLVYNIAIQFAPYLSYAYIFSLVSEIIKSGKRHVFSFYGVILTLLMIYVGISGNSKAPILAIGLGYIFCLIAFRLRLKWTVLVGGFVALAFLSEFVFPAIHIVRGQRDRLNPIEVAMETTQTIANLVIGDKETLALKDALVINSEDSDPDAYQNSYFGSRQVWLDRFTDTGFIDAIARRVDFDGPFLGQSFILDQTLSFLPRQFNPSKTTTFQVGGGDRVTQAFGLTSRDNVGFATVPLPIELFVSGGFPFLFIVGVPLIFLFILLINFAVFDFHENPWAIIFLLTYGMLFYASTYDVYVFVVARQIPSNILIMLGILILSTSIHAGIRGAARAGPGAMSFRRPRLIR